MLDDNTYTSELASHIGNLSEPVFGKYRGVVIDVDDPEKRGRLRLNIPTLLAFENTNWALPCVPYGGAKNIGSYFIPPIQSRVWVEFEQGNIANPIWTGTYWTGKVAAPAAEPVVHAIQTPFGHKFILDDTEGKEKIVLSHAIEGMPSLVIDEKGRAIINDSKGAKITLDADAGEIVVADANGNTVTLNSDGIELKDANSNSITLASSGISLKGQSITLDATSISLGKGASEPVILGQSFIKLFMMHTHPTGVGPSGPPIPTGSEVLSLSQVSKTK
jgi:Type VI secretion system/phage-baseplate injector OB domain